MSINKEYLYKTIALILVSAFVYVQYSALSCGMDHMNDSKEATHHHQSNESEKHHHNAGKKEENEKGCCSDFTQTFFSTFSKSSTVSIGFSLNLLVVDFGIAFPPVSHNTCFYTLNGVISNYSLPPPKIPDIRVLIRSFQV